MIPLKQSGFSNKEGSLAPYMRRRLILRFLLIGLPALPISSLLASLRPLHTTAQDRILPLKIKVGEKAPNFALLCADGQTVKLSDYTGHNVLIDFYRGYW
jgi:cytochrome oxidase Cu insertion factor (SCO1/SenC/PrrC family)